jgi:hypothetical protein
MSWWPWAGPSWCSSADPLSRWWSTLAADGVVCRSGSGDMRRELVPQQATFALSTASQGRRSQGRSPKHSTSECEGEDAASGVSWPSWQVANVTGWGH